MLVLIFRVSAAPGVQVQDQPKKYFQAWTDKTRKLNKIFELYVSQFLSMSLRLINPSLDSAFINYIFV